MKQDLDIVTILEKQRKCIKDIQTLKNIINVHDDPDEMTMCGIHEFDLTPTKEIVVEPVELERFDSRGEINI